MSQDIVNLPEDESWVFESLVNFLHGPLWKLPVSGFMEEKSVVFDPESYNEELTVEREAEFRKIHEEYKEVVDFMLGSFMEDLEVTPEQVEEACRSRNHSSASQQDSLLTKAALQQLSAAEDFETFRRLMTRKNIDLQLQSLELLVAKYGVLSPSLRTSGEGAGLESMDDDFFQLVLRYTHERAKLDGEIDHEMHQSSTHTQNTQTKPPWSLSQMNDSSSEEFMDVKILPTDALVEAIIESKEPADENEEDEIMRKTFEEIKSTAPEQRTILTKVRQALEDSDSGTAPGVTETISKPAVVDQELSAGQVTEEDIQRRRDYMKNQRDKLIALKKKEREKLVGGGSQSSMLGGPSRPKSAKAAQLALIGKPKATNTEKSLAARRALADRLKSELQNH